MARKQVIPVPDLPAPTVPLSRVVRFGELVYVSGTGGRNMETDRWGDAKLSDESLELALLGAVAQDGEPDVHAPARPPGAGDARDGDIDAIESGERAVIHQVDRRRIPGVGRGRGRGRRSSGQRGTEVAGIGGVVDHDPTLGARAAD